jgi:hypothetical protein
MYSIQVPKLKFIVSLFSGFQTNRLLHFRNNSSGSCSDGLLDWKSLGRFLDRVDNCGPRGEARGSAGCAVFDFWFWGHGERFWRYVLDSRIYVEELWGMCVSSKGHKDIYNARVRFFVEVNTKKTPQSCLQRFPLRSSGEPDN